MANFSQAIRATLSGLQDTSKIYDAEKQKASDLPPAFHEVAKALPPAQDTLDALRPTLRKPTEEQGEDEAQQAALAMNTKAGRLHAIFSKVLPDGATPRMVRYRSEAKRGEAVELLMSDIINGILIVVKGKSAVGKEQITNLERALAELKKVAASLEEDSGDAFHNYGTGTQNVHTGPGEQNVNTGSGFMFSNSHFSAPFHFPGSKP